MFSFWLYNHLLIKSYRISLIFPEVFDIIIGRDAYKFFFLLPFFIWCFLHCCLIQPHHLMFISFHNLFVIYFTFHPLTNIDRLVNILNILHTITHHVDCIIIKRLTLFTRLLINTVSISKGYMKEVGPPHLGIHPESASYGGCLFISHLCEARAKACFIISCPWYLNWCAILSSQQWRYCIGLYILWLRVIVKIDGYLLASLGGFLYSSSTRHRIALHAFIHASLKLFSMNKFISIVSYSSI